MRQRLIDLRARMKEAGVSAYIIPTTDFHGSEYVNDYFKCRKFVSGFTGSAGTLAVTEQEAFLWTDGRYFLQAANQLDSSGIGLMKSGRREFLPLPNIWQTASLPPMSSVLTAELWITLSVASLKKLRRSISNWTLSAIFGRTDPPSARAESTPFRKVLRENPQNPNLKESAVL